MNLRIEYYNEMKLLKVLKVSADATQALALYFHV